MTFTRGSSLLARMSFATKFAIVGIVILLPLGYLTFAYVGLKASQVDFSSKEQVGVKYLTPVNALLGQVVQARSANVASLATGGTAKSTVFSANIQAVDKVDSKYGHSLNTTQMWLNVKNEVNALPSQKFDNAKAAFDAYTKVTTDVQGLITEAGNNSNLILDPDLDSFYVMDSFVVQAPALIDVAGQFADTKYLARDGSDHATDLAVLQGQVASRNAAIATDTATALKNTKDTKLKGALNDALAAQQNAVDAVLGNNNPDATSANNSLNATNSYSTVLGPQLTHLIDVRKAAFVSNERQVEAIALICTVIAICLFVSMVRWLNRSIRSIINPLEESSSQLQVMGGLMASNTRATATQAQGASATADEISSNVQMIAAALEEMEATVREVANSASSVSNIAVSASSSAEHANATISKLGDSSQEIGKVLDVIASIADQTNLLALNATIEAARAGDAGKGFAVVASEVKDLAKETASATEEISGRITQIQHDTQLSVQAIGEITRIIEEIKEAQLSIAGAVEEQQVTTTEISRNVVDSAQGVGNIAEVIREVASTARATSDGIEGVLQKAGELTGVAGDVNDIIYGTGKDGGSQGPTLESSHRQQPRRDFEGIPGRTRPHGQDRQPTYLNQ